MNILFRTAGGQASKKQLGLGHVYRCLHLASFLKSHKIFFLLEDYGKAKLVLQKHGFKNIQTTKTEICLIEDIEQTDSFIKKNKIDLIIIDKYKIKNEYVKAFSRLTKTIVISDLWKIDYDVNLVVNGFIGFKNQIKFNKFGARCLLGPKYQILDKNYANKTKKRNQKFILLATFGGYDENHLIDTLCSAIENYLDKIQVKIIIGPATIITKKMMNFKNKYQKSVTMIRFTKNMKKEISNCFFGICSGGITSYEFAALNKPFAIICQTKHQLLTAHEWEKRKIAKNLGLPNSMTIKKIQNYLDKILDCEIITLKNIKTIDGKGTKRVANEVIKLTQPK